MTPPITCIFFGRSGCGKGTQAALLKAYLEQKEPKRPVLTIETGKELRNFINEYTPKGNHTAGIVKEILENGGLLPEFIPIWVWTKYLVEQVTGTEHWVFDGLSRRPSEAPVLNGAFKFYKRERPFVILVEVSRKWSMERLLARGRYDDSREEITKRLDWFDEQVVPTIEFFKKHTEYYRFLTINGEQTIEKVQKDIITELEK